MSASRSRSPLRPLITDAGRSAALALGGAVLFQVADPGAQIQLGQWLIYGLLALSLSFVWGWARIFSFGQTLFFGVAAYTYGVTGQMLQPVTQETLTSAAIAVAVGTMLAAALAYLMFYGGVTDVYVAVITLAGTLVAFSLMGATAGPEWQIGGIPLGGFNGLNGAPPLTVGQSSLMGVQFSLALLATLALTYVALRAFMRSNTGRVIAATSDNPERSELLGYDNRWCQFLVFTIGGAIASLAGVFYASFEGIVTPEIFGLGLAGFVVVWVMVGGRALLAGGILGAVAVGYLTDTIQYIDIGGQQVFANQTPLVLGVVLVAVVLFFPGGLLPAAIGVIRRLRDLVWRTRRPEPAGRPASAVADAESLTGRAVGLPPKIIQASREPGTIRLEDVVKRFGGIPAVAGVNLDITDRTVRCLLGPNGAGKTTLFHLVMGRHRATSGTVWLDGRDITTMPTRHRVRQGMGIKKQIPCIFPELTVRENLWVAAYARHRSRASADQAAEEVARWLRLEDRLDTLAGKLAHGDQQWLEIGMVLSTGPGVVLLDEPTAGMTALETTQVAMLIRKLSQVATVVVVEHDMEFVRLLDAPVTIMVNGCVFREGSVDLLREDPEVLDVYVGRTAHA